jgi:hypothetical protein
VGYDTTKESNQAIKRTKKIHEVIEHIEEQLQKYFSKLIIKKPNEVGHLIIS